MRTLARLGAMIAWFGTGDLVLLIATGAFLVGCFEFPTRFIVRGSSARNIGMRPKVEVEERGVPSHPSSLNLITNLGFAPQSLRTRSWWCGTSGRPSPWSCPTAATRRNLARFLGIRARQTAVSARGNARWRRLGGRSVDRRTAAPQGGCGRELGAGRLAAVKSEEDLL